MLALVVPLAAIGATGPGPVEWISKGLAYIPFVNPIRMPQNARLLMFFPLALCVAAVYRATRARSARELPRPTLITFFHIVVGMAAIAVAFLLVHEAVRAWA
jgi:NAD/NADP transhydrogenase beta subunit